MTPPPRNTSEDYSATFAWGTLVGLLIGAGVAIWYAPRSGHQTRDWLKGMAQQTGEAAKEKIQGESIEQSLAQGRALAHHYRAQHARES